MTGGRAETREAPAFAFPNAYISTDEAPRRSLGVTVLCAAAIVGVGYLGMVILVLSLIPTGYSPVSQVASDYGVGRFAAFMNAGFVAAGVGVVSLAAVSALSREGRTGKTGSLLLGAAGVSLLLDGLYHADIEGAPVTFNGTLHASAGVAFFFAAALGLLLVSRGISGRRFALTLAALALAFASLVLNSAFALDANGLAERIVILVVFTSAITTAVTFLRRG
jgi:hypothetical membrane protein